MGDPSRARLRQVSSGATESFLSLPTASPSAYSPPNQHLRRKCASLAQFFLGKLRRGETPPLPNPAARSKLIETGDSASSKPFKCRRTSLPEFEVSPFGLARDCSRYRGPSTRGRKGGDRSLRMTALR